jgi:hypothetical protein
MHPPSSTPDFPHIGPLTVIVISRLSNSNLRFCVSSRLLYSGLEASEISLSSSAGQAIRPAVASMRSVGDLRSWFSNIWRTIGRQPNNRFHVTEPGVQERLVVGDPMLNTRGWSCFSQLITGGVGSGQGNRRNRKRSRSQRVGKNAFQGEPPSFERNARSNP